MSQVLVESPSVPSTFVMPSLNMIDSHESGLHCQDPISPSPEERKMVMQLACMASQHHSSEYNRMKFGPVGPPLEYIPMSIQFPAQVRDLKSRQTVNAKKKAWWPAKSDNWSSKQGSSISPHNDLFRFASSNSQYAVTSYPHRIHLNEDEACRLQNKRIPPINYHPAVDLQLELSVAMSSSLSLITIPQYSTQTHSSLRIQAKTSQSHPINISAIIPPELLPHITSHLELTFNQASHMFELPPSLFLHRLLLPQAIPESAHAYPFMHIYNGNVNGPVNGAGPPDCNIIPPEHTKFGTLPTQNAQIHNTIINDDTHKTNSCFSMSVDGFRIEGRSDHSSSEDFVVSDVAPRERLHPVPHLITSHVSTLGSLRPSLSTPPLSELVRAMSTDIFKSSSDAEKRRFTSMNASNACGIVENSAVEYINSPLLPTLGNILLSSCPGKKVRLSGPVKGRGAICRDLGHDLRRIKSLGVGCIICCLDDEELEFLGAPWPQYSEIAHSEGLDVLRIPIPEGLAPLSAFSLDQQLSHLIHSYTLKGIPVLVHCRGGVGRAGLIACCWMLKLGLCGWLSGPLANFEGDATSSMDGSTLKVRKDSLELVERAIAVVRRRRSSKAIETYEQVKFLVDFVEFMREHSNSLKEARVL